MVTTRNSRPTWWPLPGGCSQSVAITAHPCATWDESWACSVRRSTPMSSRSRTFLVEVVEEGAPLPGFGGGGACAGWDRRRGCVGLVAGHVAVVLDNSDVVRTFLNEARMLDEVHRARVIAARDAYEAAFRRDRRWVWRTGRSGRGRIRRWRRFSSCPSSMPWNAGTARWALDRAGLVDAIVTAAMQGIAARLAPSSRLSPIEIRIQPPLDDGSFTVQVPWLVMSRARSPSPFFSLAASIWACI